MHYIVDILRQNLIQKTKHVWFKSNKPRYCHVGAGVEEVVGNGMTPGFELIKRDIIEFDIRGFKILKLQRTISKRLIQSSMITLQSWRGNNDVKVLIYDTHPMCPDMREIANVSNYVVAYTCKGHKTLEAERDIIVDSIKK